MALSQGIRVKLEAQRLLLKEKLDQLGSRDPPSVLLQDTDSLWYNTNNVCSVLVSFLPLSFSTSVFNVGK